MSETASQLDNSAFLASVDDRERSLWRLLASLSLGPIGGLAAAVIVDVAALLVFALGSGMPAANPGGFAQHIMQLISSGGSTLTGAMLILVVAVSTNCPTAAGFVAIGAFFSRRRFMDYVTAAPRFRWRLLLAGLLLCALFTGPLILAGLLTDPKAPRPPILQLAADPGTRAFYAAACILLFIPAAAAEEIVFRGWLLRHTAALVRRPALLMIPAAMILNGTAFSAFHGDFVPLLGAVIGLMIGLAAARLIRLGGSRLWLDVLAGVAGAAAGAYLCFHAFGWKGDWGAFLMRAIMGAGFVYMTLRLGGTELSTGAHAANNILIVLFIQPISLQPQPPSGLDLSSVVQMLFLFASYVVIAEVVARWTPLRRWTGAALAPAAAQGGDGGPWSHFD
ncbi:MAG: type II CAAX prenyl endopeptidase Rce1 family protein [Caulobacterales bacterium]